MTSSAPSMTEQLRTRVETLQREAPRASTSHERTMNSTGNNFIDRVLRRARAQRSALEQIVNIERNTEIASLDSIQRMDPRRLYSIGIFNDGSSIYQHDRTESLALPDGQQINLRLMTTESAHKLRQMGREYVHLGLITVSVKGLTRRLVGGKVLLILKDERFNDTDRAILGLAEVDMNSNGNLTYLSPGYMCTINDFIKHFSIGVQTKGYKNFKGNNIALEIKFVGRVSNSMNPKFKVRMQPLIDVISSIGVKFLPPTSISSDLLAGSEWNVQMTPTEYTIAPLSASTYKDSNGNLSVTFENYKETGDLNLSESDEERND